MTSNVSQEEDWYALLSLETTADNETIRKAYKKQALKCHPDKNPNNPEAAVLFQKITKACEILLDEQARKAFDNVIRIREERKKRDGQRSEKRKRMKEDLEERERAAKRHKDDDEEEKIATKKLYAEMERLKREAKQNLMDESLIPNKEENETEQNKDMGAVNKDTVVKIQWDVQSETLINELFIRDVFKDYGEIVKIMDPKKKKQKIGLNIIFKSPASARAAAQNRHPLFTVKWLGNDMEASPIKSKDTEALNSTSTSPSLVGHADYESLTLTRLKRQAERQKIIQQMAAEEALST